MQWTDQAGYDCTGGDQDTIIWDPDQDTSSTISDYLVLMSCCCHGDTLLMIDQRGKMTPVPPSHLQVIGLTNGFTLSPAVPHNKPGLSRSEVI